MMPGTTGGAHYTQFPFPQFQWVAVPNIEIGQEHNGGAQKHLRNCENDKEADFGWLKEG